VSGDTATALERSQPSITAIIYARNATNPEHFAKIGGIHSEIIGLEPIVKPEAVSVVAVIQGQ